MSVLLIHGCLAAVSVAILIITWEKTFHQWMAARRLKVSLPVATCLLANGTYYFVVLLACEIAHMIAKTDNTASVQAVCNVLPQILMSRFMLNLRSSASSSVTSEMHTVSGRFSVPSFVVPEIGNIGESLDYAQAERLTCGLDEELGAGGNMGEHTSEGAVV
ncbi:uncharacterized protein PHACADRAFT_261692 [Phanerochaete carnosa HHB-10118-sp]|uniref:Uncharacterized protein n=1 Tax=Phanerochaete carnosa (strain HHB-10118-sp) TaxID=650164 RepID=K5VJI9_PHACS|nr:uncharacterized protein PHACADRAFT_261692 [Phanerochaete carnosa HHB-10118-sp]EKM51508.1 hypothetical protein PHACADRAFT_261692 [Phanerochaete carnosa HHB-10118-sp]